ncbi:DNA-directed RNA polymerase III subunit RPC7 [Rhinophrynus dorsalis]
MAGKGRGRGASFTFDLNAIGFAKGESLPETQIQPMPLFPSVDYKPVPLRLGEDMDYMLALKQEFRKTMKKLPYYMDKEADKQGIERYSSKYEIEAERKLQMEWIPDWRMLPREMKAVKKTKKRAKKAKVTEPASTVDVLKKIEELEKKGDEEKSDEETEPQPKKKEGSEDEEEGEVEVEDEEELEEENDYIASYFEDGDDFGGSDDNLDEATY